MLPHNVTLKVHNLSVTLNEQTILDTLNFTVSTHDVVIILGANGSGKSTLLKALMGLVPFQGSVEWSTRRIGYLPPQEEITRTNLPPLTVHDFFTLKERSRSKIIQTLKKVSLNHTILQQQFATLSTGQFQRMLLAWVIIDSPSVLLLDEPLSSIDIGGEKTIYSLLHNLWKTENFTLLLVTHDINVVWEHATHVLCLNKHLLCYTTPEKITPDLLTKLYGTTVTFHEHRNG